MRISQITLDDAGFLSIEKGVDQVLSRSSDDDMVVIIYVSNIYGDTLLLLNIIILLYQNSEMPKWILRFWTHISNCSP